MPLVKRRKPSKPHTSNRTSLQKNEAEALLGPTPERPKKEAVLQKTREAAAHINEWLSSLGLHPPTELRAVAGRKTKPRPDGDRS